MDYKKITENWVLLIGFLALCGFLYQIAYWNCFKINAIGMISIYDIVLGAIQPISQNYYILVATFITLVVFRKSLASNKPIPKLEYGSLAFGAAISVPLIVYYYYDVLVYFAFSSSIFCVYILFYFLREYYPKTFFELVIVFLITFLPVCSILSGRDSALAILKNKEYTYVISEKNVNKYVKKYNRLKYLGSTSKDYIFSNLNNDCIYLIKTDRIDTLVFYYNKTAVAIKIGGEHPFVPPRLP